MKGTQRIAWDELRRTIRSWAFNHSGAFTAATARTKAVRFNSWTEIEDATAGIRKEMTRRSQVEF